MSGSCPAPAERFVEVNGLRLHCLEWGSAGGPPLLLIHGGSAHAHWWDTFVPAVQDRFRVLALDLRGHGDSDWAQPAAYAVEDYVRDIVALVDHLALPRLALVGHSLGGTIAAGAAAALRERTTALAIIDSRLVNDADRRPSGAGVRFMRRLAQMPHPRYRSQQHGIDEYRLLPTGSGARPEILAHVAAHALRATDDGAWTFKFDRAALAAIRAHDIAAAVAELRCPILVMRGGLSPVMPSATIPALQAVAPHLEVVEIADAHHHVMLDQPEAFALQLAAFLDRAR